MVDPIKSTAEELDIPEEQVYMVVQDLFKAIREYIREFHTLKKGVLLPLFRIALKPSIIARDLKRWHCKEEKTPALLEKIAYWENILSNIRWGDKHYKQRNYSYTYDPEFIRRTCYTQRNKKTKRGQFK